MSAPVVDSPLVIVVAYRADDHLQKCLELLGDGFDTVVVDNSPSFATAEIAKCTGASYVAAPGNVGFAAGVNLGLQSAWDGETNVLLLNPDARATSQDIHALTRALRSRPNCAAVGPRLIGEDGSPQISDWPLPSPGQVWADAFGLGHRWRGRRFVVGAALLMSGSALAEVGALDERYFLYAEEADWQLRAQHAGWTVALVPSVTVSHVGGASSTRPEVRDTLFHASHEAFARRWYGVWGWYVIRLGGIIAASRRALLGSAERRREARRTLRLYLRGPASSARRMRAREA